MKDRKEEEDDPPPGEWPDFTDEELAAADRALDRLARERPDLVPPPRRPKDKPGR